MNEMRSIEDYADRMRPKTAANLLLWAIGAFLLIFVLWAAFTELDRTVRGSGRIIPSSQLQVVSNLEGGIVEEILVRTGDMVTRGAPLVRLDQTATGAEFGSNQAQFDALRMRIARLEAELAGRAPQFPVNSPGAAEQAQIERSLYASRMADLSSLLSAAQSRVTQAGRAVAEAEASLAARRSAQQAAETERNLIRPLVERGIEPRLALVQAENAAAVASSESAAAAAAVTRAQSSVAEARSTLAQQRQEWRSRAAQELAQAQAEMVALRRSLPALSARVDRTVVRSPLPVLVDAVAAGGVLLYETFARGQEELGPPRRPEFLLQPGELIEAVRERLQIVAYEHGRLEHPRPAIKQRICAIRSAQAAALPTG